MVKIISLVTVIAGVMLSTSVQAAPKVRDLVKQPYNVNECTTRFISKYKDIGKLTASMDAIRAFTGNNRIRLGTLMVSEKQDGLFQVTQGSVDRIVLKTEPNGDFDATLCGMKNGIIAVVKLHDAFQRMFVGTDTIVFAVTGDKSGKVIVSTDNDKFPPGFFIPKF